MGFTLGSHTSQPAGPLVQLSNATYAVRHMQYLGQQYVVARLKARFERSAAMRSMGFDTHYTNDGSRISARYSALLHADSVVRNLSRATLPVTASASTRTISNLAFRGE